MHNNMLSPVISAVDLFCGAGGLTHGLTLGGITVRAGVDLDPACKYPFESNNAATFVERDVNDVSADDLASYYREGEITLLAGCAPCQPFSSYSQGERRKGGRDWQLLSTFGQLVSEMQPDLVSMENVAQIADHDVFNDFLHHLDGYHVEWSIVECSTLGIPQSRRRLVLLASKLGDQGLEVPKGTSAPKTYVKRLLSSLRLLLVNSTPRILSI